MALLLYVMHAFMLLQVLNIGPDVPIICLLLKFIFTGSGYFGQSHLLTNLSFDFFYLQKKKKSYLQLMEDLISIQVYSRF